MSYSGFFVRDTLGQQPGGVSPVWSNSPDIVVLDSAPTGLDGFVSQEGYNTDFGQNVLLNGVNYIYLRALNTDPTAEPSAPLTGRAWFFFVESDLVLWPQTWRGWNGDGVTVGGNPVNYQPITAIGTATPSDPGVFGDPVCLTDLPFTWTPPPLNPGTPAGTSYSLVSWIENRPSNPPLNPVSGFGPIGSFDSLVNFVLDHPNMGWRNTVDVASAGPTWSNVVGITGPMQPTQFFVGIACNDMPTDGQVAFDVPPPGPIGSGVSMPMTTIASPDFTMLMPIGNWPGGASSTITISYQQGATAPPPGASITATLVVSGQTLGSRTMARIEAAPHGATPLVTTTPHGGESQRLVRLGARTFTF